MTVDEIFGVVAELGLTLAWDGRPVVKGGPVPKELLAVLKLRREEIAQRLRPPPEELATIPADCPPWGGAPPPDSELWVAAGEWRAMWDGLKRLERPNAGGATDGNNR